MSKHFKKVCAAFVALFALAIVAAVFLMPAPEVYAYIRGSSNENSSWQGSLTIQKVDEKGNVISASEGGSFTVTTQRYTNGSDVPNTEPNVTSSISLGQITLGPDHFYYEDSDPYYYGGTYRVEFPGENGEFLSYENEGRAQVTIHEDNAPTGYKALSGDIVLDYYYEDRYGSTYYTEQPNNVEAVYVLHVDITTNSDSAATLVENGQGTGNWVLTIKNTPTTAPTGKVIIEKALDGNDTSVDDEFIFKLTLSDKMINGTFSDVDFVNGEATLTLKGGASKEIDGLPAGTTITVKETDSKDYTPFPVDEESGTIADEGSTPLRLLITNQRNTFGNLTVAKKLAGNAADSSKEFNFTVTLTDTNGSALANRTFGSDTTDSEGKITFSLKGDESKTISNLPNGTNYTIEEDNYASDGYMVSWADGNGGSVSGNPSGTIKGAAPSPSNVTFTATNTRAADGTLTIVKRTQGNDTNAEDEFTFQITLGDESVVGTFSGIEFADGKATLKLKDGQSKTIEGLPHGVGYTVTETDALDYTTAHNGNTGTIHEDAPAVVSFTNTRDTFGSLTVTKQLAGNDTDDQAQFAFTATFTGADNMPLAHWEFGEDTTDEAGRITFSLAGGQSKNIKDLPNGVHYTITEADYTSEGYDAVVWSDSNNQALDGDPSGIIVGSTPNPSSVAFTATNTKNAGPTPDPDPNPAPNPEPEPTPDPEPDPDPTTPDPVLVDPPFSKVVTGDAPTAAGNFTFVMKALSNTAGYSVEDMPMPEGAADGIVEKTVQGPGEYEFGEYAITQAGQYQYELSEKDTAESGYTYDSAIYTITWDVTSVDNKLVAEKTITNAAGTTVDEAVFTNEFKKTATPKKDSPTTPSTKTPSSTAGTGDTSRTSLAVLFVTVLVSVFGAVLARKRME